MPSLHWIGKEKVINHDKEVPFRLLKERRDLSLNGDNLEALKALLPYYQGKVKMIYIDPPYNTGNEGWVYNDKVNSPQMKNWLGKVVGKESEDLCRHDKWLCMMMPRLKLLRELLREDGVIFVSIDDNEVHHLRMLMDEVFQDNFLGIISVVNNLKGRSDDKFIATANEFLLVYAKNKDLYEMGGFPLTEEQLSEYDKEDEWGKYKEVGFRKTGKGWRRKDRPLMFYPIYFNENTGEISLERKSKNDIEILPLTSDSREGRWRWKKKTFIERKDKDIAIRKVRTGRWSVFTKIRSLNEKGEERILLPKTVWIDPKYDTAKGAAMLREIFGEDVFDNPKPLDLIVAILRISTDEDENDIVLDSFAGSGTTAHAVLDLNKEDGGNRRFILVELEDYANEITAERVRRVIKGYGDVGGTGSGFKYLELGKPLFDCHKQIIGKPTYDDLAGYIFFTETHNSINPKKQNRKEAYLGEKAGKHYFLIFNGMKDLVYQNTLDESFLPIAKKYEGEKVIYADAVLIDDDILKEYNIVFKQIPYEIKTF